jgi:hypothetical protein
MIKPNVLKLFPLLLSLTIALIGSKDVFGQGPPLNSPKARAKAISDIKNTIENFSQKKPKVFTTSEQYVHFMMAPPGTTFTVERMCRNSPQQAAG